MTTRKNIGVGLTVLALIWGVVAAESAYAAQTVRVGIMRRLACGS